MKLEINMKTPTNHEEDGGLIFILRENTFHMNDAEAHALVDTWLEIYPHLLWLHKREWYYEYC